MKTPGIPMNHLNISSCQNCSGLRSPDRFISLLMISLIQAVFPSVRTWAGQWHVTAAWARSWNEKTPPTKVNYRHCVGPDAKYRVDTLPSSHFHKTTWITLMPPKAIDIESPLWPTWKGCCVWDQALQLLSVKSSVSYTSPVPESIRFISPSHCSLITGQIVVTSLKSLSLLTGKNRIKPTRILRALSCLCNSSKCHPRGKKISLLKQKTAQSFREQESQAS